MSYQDDWSQKTAWRGHLSNLLPASWDMNHAHISLTSTMGLPFLVFQITTRDVWLTTITLTLLKTLCTLLQKKNRTFWIKFVSGSYKSAQCSHSKRKINVRWNHKSIQSYCNLRHENDGEVEPVPWVSQEGKRQQTESSCKYLYRWLKCVNGSERIPRRYSWESRKMQC